MFCTECGTAGTDGAKFCYKCGAPLNSQSGLLAPAHSPATATSSQDVTRVAQVRPWVRFWARMVDFYLFNFVLVVAAPALIINTGIYNKTVGSMLFGMAACLYWMFAESFLLSIFGTTPGKWLLKIRLVPPSGSKPSFSAALFRSFNVYWRGVFLGIPVINLLSLKWAYDDLTKDGITTWDKDGGFKVMHSHIEPLRVTVVILIVLIWLYLVVQSNR